jgi:ABC-type multidrug transport system fused ATPase/permease subunit
MKKIKTLLARTWNESKFFYIDILLQSILRGIKPFVNVVGLSLVTDALLKKAELKQIIITIFVYLTINLVVSFIESFLRLFDNRIQRRISNEIVNSNIENSTYINYHYVQDGSVDKLKRKSLHACPETFLTRCGYILSALIQIVFSIIIFQRFSNPLIILIISISFILSFLSFKTKKQEKKLREDKIDEDRQLEYLYNVMTNYEYAKDIKMNNAKEFLSGKYEKSLNRQKEKLGKIYNKLLFIGIFTTTLIIIQTGLLYILFTYNVFQGNSTIPEYIALMSTATIITGALFSFFDMTANITLEIKAVDDYQKYHQFVNDNSNIESSNKLEHINFDESNNVLELCNVSFKYPNSDNYILKQINLKMNKGDCMGIVGLNGSGKTTLIKLLLRLYDPTDGIILFNGIDIRNIPYNQYIGNISSVLQDYYLFSYSIIENIVFDKAKDIARINECVEETGLKDKINSLEKGLDTILTKRLDNEGIEFSGGEGQKLAMARALYKNSQIIILDEPTSSLDPISEYNFFVNLKAISKEKTTIFVSHRLSSTRFCNRILVLKDAIISEDGSFEELMSKNGDYSKLFLAQAKYYEEIENET